MQNVLARHSSAAGWAWVWLSLFVQLSMWVATGEAKRMRARWRQSRFLFDLTEALPHGPGERTRPTRLAMSWDLAGRGGCPPSPGRGFPADASHSAN